MAYDHGYATANVAVDRDAKAPVAVSHCVTVKGCYPITCSVVVSAKVTGNTLD